MVSPWVLILSASSQLTTVQAIMAVPIGMVAFMVLLFGMSWLVAPYRQRNEARKQLQAIQSELQVYITCGAPTMAFNKVEVTDPQETYIDLVSIIAITNRESYTVSLDCFVEVDDGGAIGGGSSLGEAPPTTLRTWQILFQKNLLLCPIDVAPGHSVSGYICYRGFATNDGPVELDSDSVNLSGVLHVYDRVSDRRRRWAFEDWEFQLDDDP